MRRFFFDTTNNQLLSSLQMGDSLQLTEAVYHHWCRVLRAKIGDKAFLFDGFGGSYYVELIDINKKHAKVTLGEHIVCDNTPNMYTQIGLVMSRGDRMDYAIQKATEMGVTSIQLLTSEHGELRLKSAQIEKKLSHWQQVAIAACEQCGLNRIPLIVAPIDIKCWVEQLGVDSQSLPQADEMCEYVRTMLTDDFYQFLSEPADLSLLLSVPKAEKNNATDAVLDLFRTKHKDQENKPFVRLLVGSEGGLSLAEENKALTNGWQALQIGSRVLRTETAPVVALATLQTLQANASMFVAK